MIKKRVFSIFLVFLFVGGISSPLKGVNIEIPWNVIYGWVSYQPSNSWAEEVIVDESGNIYTTGASYVWDPAQFGQLIPPVTLGMYQAAFVAKWNKRGKPLWYTLLPSTGTGGAYGRGIDLDRDGNVYVAGFSWNELSFASPLISHNGNGDGFVAKLDPSGTLLWHTFLGGSGHDNLRAIDVTGNGSVVVAGESHDVWNTGVYGSPLLDYNVPGSYGSDITVARLNKDGALQWYTFLGGDDYQYPSDVKITSGGDIFLTGETLLYWPEFKYGRPLQEKLVDDQFDGILAKLSSSGIFQWYTFMGEDTTVYPMSIDYSQNGKLFLTGTKFDYPVGIVSVSSSISGNSPEKGNGIFLSSNKLYVASYSLSGEKLWAKTPYVANYSGGLSIDTGPLGDLFISGSGSDELPGIPNNQTKANPFPQFNQYVFLLNMDQSGSKKWLHKFKDKPFTSGNSVAAFNNGISYITGSNWGGFVVVSSLGSARNGEIIPIFNPGLFLVKINHLYAVEAHVKNTGGVVEPEQSEIVPGKEAVISIFPESGYEVDKIIDNGEDVIVANPYVIPIVTEDHELEIYFRLIQYPPDLILTGIRTTDNGWIIEKEFGDLTITIVEHDTFPMAVKAYVLYKYKNGEWKELVSFTEAGVHIYEDKFLTKDGEAKYVLKALAPNGTVIVETEILIL